jgi:hypothetical protein
MKEQIDQPMSLELPAAEGMSQASPPSGAQARSIAPLPDEQLPAFCLLTVRAASSKQAAR